jgi:hypothetical protein
VRLSIDGFNPISNTAERSSFEAGFLFDGGASVRPVFDSLRMINQLSNRMSANRYVAAQVALLHPHS